MKTLKDIVEIINEIAKPNNKFSSWHLVNDIYNLPRSVSGEANLKTLEIIKEELGDIFKIKEFSNENYYSWTRPKYWCLKSASIKTLDNKTIISSKDNLLHVLMHSMPIEDEISYDDLKDHLFVEEGHDFIPYRTTYYKENWGFCVNNEQLKEIQKHKKLKVKIESSLEDYSVPYGDCVINGNSDNEILITSYICHPNMANNELSGPVVTTYLSKWLSSLKNRRFTYRIVFIPETIGSIVYLSKNLR